ncbi:hypothetical protein Scep_025326 [Stephania cephalantha]|uniref:Uncharacterized protein n=1 Tax=Stephania cephalantha TaxID=152367 RepID=A0AAP0ENA3_9MAGN
MFVKHTGPVLPENLSFAALLSFFRSAPDNLCTDFASTAFLNIPSLPFSIDRSINQSNSPFSSSMMLCVCLCA